MENEHLNFLGEGLHSDNHPSLQPPNTYRHGLNGNLVTHDGNNYSFESTEGTVINWTMPLHDDILGTKFVPIGIYRIGDRLIVHSTDNSTTGGPGEIGVVNFNNAGVGTYSAKYYHTGLRYTQAHMIFGYGLEENDVYHRHYWTDDFNQPRAMNIAAPIFSTLFASGSLIAGNNYMVLTDSIGKIEYPVASGNFYGPKQALGNVFNANAGTAYTAIGSVKVIALVVPNVFNYTPEKAVGNIEFYEYNFGGSIYGGVKLYAYRLSTLDGYQSSWTFTTNPIHVTSSDPSLGEWQYEGIGESGLANSNKSITLTVSDIPSEFDKIQVAVIEVDQSYGVARAITIFWDTNISGSTMQIIHRGNENLSTLLIADLELTNSVIVRCKDMTTIKQRQIIANLSTRDEIEWTRTGTVTPFVYKTPSDQKGFESGQALNEIGSPMQPEIGVVSADLLANGHYLVKGVSGVDYVTYNGVIYGPGQVAGESFTTIYGGGGFVTTGSPTVMSVIRIREYFTPAGVPKYKYIELHNDFFDYKGMASTMYLKGYWRSETYRFGILFYDLFGNPFFVRWLADTIMPSQSDPASPLNDSGQIDLTNNFGLLKMDGTGTADIASLNILGVQIDGVDITDIIDKISGCSIVRAKRDRQRLGQGIFMPMAEGVAGGGGGYSPIAHIPLGTSLVVYDRHAALNSTLGFRAWAMGPEFDIPNSIESFSLGINDYIEPVSEIAPLLETSGSNRQWSRYNSGATDQDIMTKYYTHRRCSPSGIPRIITAVPVDIAGQVIDYDGFGNDAKNHDLATTGTHPPAQSGGGTS